MSDIEFKARINDLIENSVDDCVENCAPKNDINRCNKCLQNVGDKEVICVKNIDN